MSFGLVLSGGGCRGAAHVGVLLALEEAGLRPSSLSGASAGAIVAGLYGCGMSPDAMRERLPLIAERGARLLDVDIAGILRAARQLLLRRPVTMQGLLRGERLHELMRRYTGEASMAQMRLPVFISAVDLVSGDTAVFFGGAPRPRPMAGVRWIASAAVADAMRASSAIPGVFAPLELGGLRLVDGGVANAMPVELLVAYGEANIVAVDISEQYLPPEESVFDVAFHSLSLMSRRLSDCVGRGERLRIRPVLPQDAGVFAFDKVERCFEAGYRAAKELVPVIRALSR